MYSLGGNCAPAFQLKVYGKRKFALPFDWCKMNTKMLLSVLKEDFKDFTILKFFKISNQHPNFEKLINSSLVLKNNYGIQFAHELSSESEIEIFSCNLKKRIDRFKSLKNPTFIRLETQNLNHNQIKLYYDIEVELKKIFGVFKLILVSNLEYQSVFTQWIKLEQFESDWKYPKVKWNQIII
jgi:hypothetical protein